MNFEIFDENYYLLQYPWVKASIEAGQFTSGLDHFKKIGMEQRKLIDVSRYFDESYYLANNVDVANAVASDQIPSGLFHFIQFGYQEGRTAISSSYNEDYYLKRYPDLVPFIQNGTFKSGLQHFLLFGQKEGRLATNFFEPEYLLKNPDVNLAVAQGLFKTGFDHYLKAGQFEPSRSAIFMGTNESDIVEGFGVGTVEITGVPLSLDQLGKRVYEREIKPNGNPGTEPDTLIGGAGSNQFILGDGYSFYFPFEGPSTIINLDPTQDMILLGGLVSNYIQLNNGSPDLFLKQRFNPLAEIEIQGGVDFLKNYPFRQWLKSSIVTTIDNFGEFVYLARNPDVEEAVEAGNLSSGFEHYQQFGQFEPNRSTAFLGTDGNDTITAFGVGKKDIIGVLAESVAGRFLSYGENEFDTLIGSEGADNFILANSYIIDRTYIPDAIELYRGAGEATIRNFNQSQGDTIQLVGQLANYQIFPVGNDLVISKNGDTIARLEGGANLNLTILQPTTESIFQVPLILG